jgi:hypothetical protein
MVEAPRLQDKLVSAMPLTETSDRSSLLLKTDVKVEFIRSVRRTDRPEAVGDPFWLLCTKWRLDFGVTLSKLNQSYELPMAIVIVPAVCTYIPISVVLRTLTKTAPSCSCLCLFYRAISAICDQRHYHRQARHDGIFNCFPACHRFISDFFKQLHRWPPCQLSLFLTSPYISDVAQRTNQSSENPKPLYGKRDLVP